MLTPALVSHIGEVATSFIFTRSLKLVASHQKVWQPCIDFIVAFEESSKRSQHNLHIGGLRFQRHHQVMRVAFLMVGYLSDQGMSTPNDKDHVINQDMKNT